MKSMICNRSKLPLLLSLKSVWYSDFKFWCDASGPNAQTKPCSIISSFVFYFVSVTVFSYEIWTRFQVFGGTKVSGRITLVNSLDQFQSARPQHLLSVSNVEHIECVRGLCGFQKGLSFTPVGETHINFCKATTDGEGGALHETWITEYRDLPLMIVRSRYPRVCFVGVFQASSGCLRTTLVVSRHCFCWLKKLVINFHGWFFITFHYIWLIRGNFDPVILHNLSTPAFPGVIGLFSALIVKLQLSRAKSLAREQPDIDKPIQRFRLKSLLVSKVSGHDFQSLSSFSVTLNWVPKVGNGATYWVKLLSILLLRITGKSTGVLRLPIEVFLIDAYLLWLAY